MKKFINEFKEFAMRGNVIDLAVGVVIGGAFSAIVKSLVEDIITPIISLITNSPNFDSIKLDITSFGGQVVTISTGNFLEAVINFLLITLSIFVVIKLMNRFKKKKDAPLDEPAQPSEEVVLLTKIYEELKKNK